MTITISIDRQAKKWAVFKDDFTLAKAFTPYTDEGQARAAAHDWIGEQNWGDGVSVEVTTVYPRVDRVRVR